MRMTDLKLIECPRDAMQGWHDFISTERKINYINQILECGFDTVDFGSFVSPKAIPQMRDTADVLAGLNMDTSSKLLAIVANERGAVDAAKLDEISYLGYPFSISETFQKRNTNATIEESLSRVEQVQNQCVRSNKELVVYVSMGFGNPYGDPWHPDVVNEWALRLYKDFDVKVVALSDTIGCATEEIVTELFSSVQKELPEVEVGAHLHVVPEKATRIVKAAYDAGCRRFDGAIKGFGGCPMAKDDLTGNMPTEEMLRFFDEQTVPHGVDKAAFVKAEALATKLFV